MFVCKLPPLAGLVEAIFVEGGPFKCPRCGRLDARTLFVFARRLDSPRAIVHCGCLAADERNGAPVAEAPQTMRDIMDAPAWQARLDARIKDLFS